MKQELIVPCAFVNAEHFEKYLNNQVYKFVKKRAKGEMSYVITIDDPIQAFWIGANSLPIESR